MIRLAYGVIVLLVVALDQVTKAWVRHAFVPGESLPIVPGVLRLTYVRNPGVAFGLFAGYAEYLIALTVVVLLVFLVYHRRQPGVGVPMKLGYALGLAGALGNLIDRIRFGWVVDFIDLGVWPVFNVADSAIVVGVALLAWRMLWDERRAKPEESAGERA